MFLTDDLPSRNYDCYVIGAGPAGITLSLELAKANRTVLVFETGTVTEPRDDMPNVVNYGHFRDGWWDRHSIRVLGRHLKSVVGLVCHADGCGLRQPGRRRSVAHHEVRSGSVLSTCRPRAGSRTGHSRRRDAARTWICLPAVLAEHSADALRAQVPRGTEYLLAG